MALKTKWIFFLVTCLIWPLGVVAQEKSSPDTSQADVRPLPSPKGAMIRSALFPGWGQWYNGKRLKAAVVFLGESGIIGAAFYWNQRAREAQNEQDRLFYLEQRNVSLWYLGGAILLSMADAYVDAHLAGFDVSPELAAGQAAPYFLVTLTKKF